MSEHKATIAKQFGEYYTWRCECGPSGAWRHREEAVSAYQSHVYEAMGREAAELLAPFSGLRQNGGFKATDRIWTVDDDGQQAGVNFRHRDLRRARAFLDRQRAALEVEGA